MMNEIILELRGDIAAKSQQVSSGQKWGLPMRPKELQNARRAFLYPIPGVVGAWMMVLVIVPIPAHWTKPF